MKRVLGHSGIEVSAMGLGCWAIGGPFTDPGGIPVGWGEIDDADMRKRAGHGWQLLIGRRGSDGCLERVVRRWANDASACDIERRPT